MAGLLSSGARASEAEGVDWRHVSALDGSNPTSIPFGLPTASEAQDSRFSPELDAVLRQAGPRDIVPILVRLRSQGMTAAQSARIRSQSRTERRQQGIRHLQDLAASTQVGVMTRLKILETAGEAENIRPLWLVNAIAAHLPAERVYDLLAFPEVEKISWDPAVDFEDMADGEAGAERFGLATASDGPVAFRGTPDIHAQLDRIRAPDCWASSFDGTGVTVAIIDKGVDYTHPDLADRIAVNLGEIPGDLQDNDNNGFVDDFLGWDFLTNDNDPFETGPEHGTPVAGLVCGDGANGTITGAAPGARFVPIRCSGLAWSNVFAGLGYAALRGVDVIAMSVTQKWDGGIRPDMDAWRAAVENEYDLGIFHANSVGNKGLELDDNPTPFNVATPGNCPSAWQSPYDFHVGGKTSVVAAGAVQENVDTIRDQSGRGPVAWEDLSAFIPDYPFSIREDYQDHPWSDGSGGLIKPDLCAPGENSLSLGYGGSYLPFSGTSAATPYVAGAMAILLQARPSITLEEMSEALQMGAADLGPAGKDNVYGSGLLDCFASLEYVLNLDDQSYLSGVVRNAATLDSLAGVDIEMLAPPAQFRSNEKGLFELPVESGLRVLVVSKYGFAPDTLTFNVVSGTTYDFAADLDSLTTATVAGTVLGPNAEPLPGATIQIVGAPMATLTDSQGRYSLDDVPAEKLLQFEAFRFNYSVASDTLTMLAGAVDTLDFTLNLGLFDDFERDLGWIVGDVGDDATQGFWELGDPAGTFASDGETAVQPDEDFTEFGDFCFLTQNGHAGAGRYVSDVKAGKTTLRSPIFDATGYSAPVLSYWRWYSNDTGAASVDSFKVSVSNDGGVEWVDIDVLGETVNTWTLVTIDLASKIALTDQMQLRFVAADNTLQAVVEAAVDDISIASNVADVDGPDGPNHTDLGPRYALSLRPGVPNPFRDETSIGFQIPSQDQVRLQVFDVQGRRVRTLIDGELEAGSHTVQWDGRDERGRTAAAGLYFYRLQSGGDAVQGRTIKIGR